VSVIQSIYKDATTVVRVSGRDSKAFGVRVGVHNKNNNNNKNDRD